MTFDFNPRSREGSDLRLFRRHGGDEVISIHAPVKGATASECYTDDNSSISIHAPVKGATVPARVLTATVTYFNPRSREGSDCSMIHPMTNI